MKSIDNKNSLNIIAMLLDGKILISYILDCLDISSSTLYKHIKVLKKAGFHIRRENDYYELFVYKNCAKFANYELSILSYLLLIVNIMLPKKKFEYFYSAINKILCLTNKQNYYKVKDTFENLKKASISEYYSEKISILNKYINSKNKVKIIIKDTEEMEIFPIELYWEKEKLNLKYIDLENETKTILLDNIVQICEKNDEIKFTQEHETIFEIRGKLAKSYLLKENERIIDSYRDKIIVANSQKDKDKLFRRLLRYDIYCKVLLPKVDVLKFKEMIEKSLANIEEISDNI